MNRLLIIIVNYNSGKCLEECLQSLQRETSLEEIQVVVVDNASVGGDLSRAQTLFPWVNFILNSKNLGFAAACNQGLESQQAHLYLLLNPDTIVRDRAIERVVGFFGSTPDAGIVGCRVENPDGTLQRASRRSIPTIENSFYRLLGLDRLFPGNRRFGRYNARHLDPEKNEKVEAVSGSFLMCRHALLEQISGLDERFFLYGEDLDFCFRALQQGWSNYYFAGARVLHRKSQSAQSVLEASTFHFYNAMKLFYDKHYSAQHNRLLRRIVHLSVDLLHFQARLRQKVFRRGIPGSAG